MDHLSSELDSIRRYPKASPKKKPNAFGGAINILQGGPREEQDPDPAPTA
jgi:hypothetical protein